LRSAAAGVALLASESADIGWNVVGYPSLDSAARDRRDEALSCYLYRG
jgi:hypothetical protein